MSEVKFPEWYLRKREKALELLKNARPAKYGSDLNLDEYQVKATKHEKLKSLKQLKGIEIEKVGQRKDEKLRAGTHLQIDDDTVYLHFTPLVKDLAKKGIVILDTRDAICSLPWLKNYWCKALPFTLDKYSNFVAAYERGGVFVWIKKNVKVEIPIQACFGIETNNYAQAVHNIIIAEPNSKVHLITGCTIAEKCKEGGHFGITEIFIGEGAEVTWSMIHRWKENFEVRPRIGVMVEKNGKFMENYILLSEVKDIQLYPTVVLNGANAKASLRMLIVGRGSSNIDAGGGIIFNAPRTRGEIMSRSVITDKAKVKMRGLLKSLKSNVKGHLECRGLLLSEKAEAHAFPHLQSNTKDADLTHEAAIGKIAEDQLNYLMSRGLTKEEATAMIARGFLDTDIPGLPIILQQEISRLVSLTTEEIM